MLELENFDLELAIEEDFPSGPIKRVCLFDNSACETVSAGENSNTDCKSLSDNVKNDSKNPQVIRVNDLISQIFQSSEKNENLKPLKNDEFRIDPFPNDFCNSSVSVEKLNNCGNGSNDLRGVGTAKRILAQRKFPGPAGLLPDKPLKEISDLHLIIDNSLENSASEQLNEAVILCSQSSTVFSEAFMKLYSDFDLDQENCPLNKYNIGWVKKRAVNKAINGRKIPFLAVVIHYVDHSTPDPVLTLKDQTGEVYGTLHRDVWAELGGKLHSGTALALRQVGVLVTGVLRRQIYLNITSKNILNVYSYSSEGSVEKNIIHYEKKSELIKSAHEWNISISNSGQNNPVHPFSLIGGKEIDMASTSGILNSFNSSKSSSNKSGPYNAVKNKISSSSSVNSLIRKLNNYDGMVMEDEISDFIASLDENTISGKSPSETGNGKFLGDSFNSLFENKVRKRKVDEDNTRNLPNKSYCTGLKNSSQERSSPVSSNNFSERNLQDKRVLQSQILSQAESQIVDEVLDGISFDDFD